MKNLNKELQSAILITVGVISSKIWFKLTSNTGMSFILQMVIYSILVIFVGISISYIIKYLKNKKKKF